MRARQGARRRRAGGGAAIGTPPAASRWRARAMASRYWAGVQAPGARARRQPKARTPSKAHTPGRRRTTTDHGAPSRLVHPAPSGGSIRISTAVLTATASPKATTVPQANAAARSHGGSRSWRSSPRITGAKRGTGIPAASALTARPAGEGTARTRTAAETRVGRTMPEPSAARTPQRSRRAVEGRHAIGPPSPTPAAPAPASPRRSRGARGGAPLYPRGVSQVVRRGTAVGARTAPVTGPVRRGVVAGLAAYQRWVSPLLPRRCRFWPSCSEYARIAIARRGLARGGLLAARRLLRCHPFHPGGVDLPPDEPARAGG